MYPTEQDMLPIYRRVFAIQEGKRPLVMKRLFAFIVNAGFLPSWFLEMPETNLKNYRSQTVRINFSEDDFEYKKLYLELQTIDGFEQITTLKRLLRYSIAGQSAASNPLLIAAENSQALIEVHQTIAPETLTDKADSEADEISAEIERRRKQNAKMYL